MISLVFFPLLCVIYLYQTKAFQSEYAIEINVWNKEDGKRIKKMYGWEEHPPRNYLEFYMTGNDKEDQISLNKAQLAFRRMVKTQDTIFGVHITFMDNAHYWTFISVLDRLEEEHVKQYIPIGNHLWIFNSNPKPYIEDKSKFMSVCGNHFYKNIEYYKENAAIELKERNEKYFNLLKQLWGPGILFLLLLILSFNRIKKV